MEIVFWVPELWEIVGSVSLRHLYSANDIYLTLFCIRVKWQLFFILNKYQTSNSKEKRTKAFLCASHSWQHLGWISLQSCLQQGETFGWGRFFFFNGKKKRPWTRKPIVPSNMVFLVALSLKTLPACSNSWENASSGQNRAPCVVREDSVTLSSC